MSFKAIRENKILAKISEMVPLLSSKKYLSMVIPELLYGVLDPPSPSKPWENIGASFVTPKCNKFNFFITAFKPGALCAKQF